MSRGWVAALTTAACLAFPAAGLAACPKTSVGDVEDEVMCPVCGTPLALATEAPQARRERAFILDLVERCRSKEQVKAALVAEFGDSVLALPDDEGFDLAAYLVPAFALLAGGAAVLLAGARWRRRAAPAGGAPVAREVAGAEAPPGADGAGGAPGGEEEERLSADMERYDL